MTGGSFIFWDRAGRLNAGTAPETECVAMHPADGIIYAHDIPGSLSVKHLDARPDSNLLFNFACLGRSFA
jgi:hypothetical protein